MTTDTINLDAIAEPMRESVGRYLDLVRAVGGESVSGLTLFGAIAAGGFDPKRHTMQSVLLVEQVDLERLRRLAEHGAELGRMHIGAPLVMTAKYIDASRDTFPLELIEIGQKHVTLFGADPFADLSFDEKDVRMQCERELKTMMIGMRQGLLAAGGRMTMLGELERDAGAGLLRTLRGLLWLAGQKEGQPAEKVVAGMESRVDSRLVGVRDAIDPDGAHSWDQFVDLYRDVEALAEYANAL